LLRVSRIDGGIRHEICGFRRRVPKTPLIEQLPYLFTDEII